MYTIKIREAALRFLQKMPRNEAERIRNKIHMLAANPYTPNNNVKALSGRIGYRLRVGDWRVIYEIHDTVLVIEVIKIGSRGDVYS